MWGGHLVNEPFSKGSVSSVLGKSLLPWRYWLSFSCKRDATSVETMLVTCCDLILLPPPPKPRVRGAVICELFLHLLCCRVSGLNSAPGCCLRFLEDGCGRQINLFCTAKAGKWRIIMSGLYNQSRVLQLWKWWLGSKRKHVRCGCYQSPWNLITMVCYSVIRII